VCISLSFFVLTLVVYGVVFAVIVMICNWRAIVRIGCGREWMVG
jgi:hypothetical protein